MRISARAKINWTLDIMGQREDGYHLMDMLMQPVTLADDVFLTPAESLTLTCGGQPLLPADERHLALRAARALQAYTGCSHGAKIHVEKRIPVGAGMGGGSADAAAVLQGLNLLWDCGLSQHQLEAIGLTLGADVPFCLRGGLTRTTGIGEELQPLPCGRCWPLVVIQPCEGLSTREVFTAYHQDAPARRPDTEAAARALANVLQPVSEARRNDIRDAIAALCAQPDCCTALMTGSGSAVFGVFATEEAADDAAEVMRRRWTRTYRCSTCHDSIVIHPEA